MSHSDVPSPSVEPKPTPVVVDDKVPAPAPPSTSGDGAQNEKPSEQKFFNNLELPSFIGWVPDKLNWSNLKPVIRSALAAWIALVMILVPQVENVLGQVGISQIS